MLRKKFVLLIGYYIIFCVYGKKGLKMVNYKKKLVDVMVVDILGVFLEKWVEGGRGGRDEVCGLFFIKNFYVIYD